MSAIRSKDTKPEMIVRRGLWSRGFRYRLNHKRLPGHPDLVLRKYRTCIFVNGCFWHGHFVEQNKMESSECCKIPKTNREFWVAKIRRNLERDVEVQHQLASMGWHCITIWECELKPKVREKTLESLTFTLNRIFLQDDIPTSLVTRRLQHSSKHITLLRSLVRVLIVSVVNRRLMVQMFHLSEQMNSS